MKLHLREDGEAWTVHGFRTAWGREFTYGADHLAPRKGVKQSQEKTLDPAKAAAMKRLREEGFVFHGLRKNAVIMLLEVGCTEDEVAAIVEMTPAMVRHYGKEVNKRRLAVNAMKKLEQGWAETRKNLFGGAQSPIIAAGRRG